METVPLLEGNRIVLGVTGGIAAYKICTLASHLTQAGAQVDVVMTEAATRFVAPLTFEALTGRPVYTSMWRPADRGLPTHIAHVGLAHAASLLVIAPATANTMSKLAHGMADNLLSTLALAARCPVLLAPSMDVGMWNHAATQANVAVLRERGVRFAGPARGRMASGLEGEGRLAEPDEILGHIRLALGQRGPLVGHRVVVSAGPTREFLDPVRFLSNPSSGRQGFALAHAALDRGAEVTLVAGPVHLSTPVGAERIDVVTAEEMREAVLDESATADALLMSAAVVDYRPDEYACEKIKKSAGDLLLRLVRAPDILATVADRRGVTHRPRVVVGFAAETEGLLENARAKLQAKNLDLIVANDVTAPDAGFGSETNRVLLLDRDGDALALPLMSKAGVAQQVLNRIVDLLLAQD
ncbi:MAG: bifunctional phosphopantothenoylcysteine decarboxylase/phosphopantothenate--cysteine ligase CoaBC [Anaerolineae bacterium]|jgi:phosphopantothenoylcysteine decarboxylase/phosphopantothenate--cysteine ligase